MRKYLISVQMEALTQVLLEETPLYSSIVRIVLEFATYDTREFKKIVCQITSASHFSEKLKRVLMYMPPPHMIFSSHTAAVDLVVFETCGLYYPKTVFHKGKTYISLEIKRKQEPFLLDEYFVTSVKIVGPLSLSGSSTRTDRRRSRESFVFTYQLFDSMKRYLQNTHFEEVELKDLVNLVSPAKDL